MADAIQRRLLWAALIALALIFNAFAIARALPTNSTLPINGDQVHGDYDRNVYRVERYARKAASQPFFAVRDHGLLFNRNPALFMAVSETFFRGGATTVLPNQLFCIALWNCGFLVCFLWLRRLFDGPWPALAGVTFAVFTPYALYNSSSIHNEAYAFLFQYITLYCYTRHVQSAATERRWLWRACVAYFVLCQFYWFYYVSTYLFLVALQVRHERFSLKHSVLLGLVPVAAFVLTVARVAYAVGGFSAAVFRLRDIAAARTGDFRIEGSQWYPHRQVLHPNDLHRYPWIVMERVRASMGFSMLGMLGVLGAAVISAGREARARYLWLLIALLAGLSWNVVMVQHTVVHKFSGMYGHAFWVLVPAVVTVELARALKGRRGAWLLRTLIATSFLWLAQRHVYAREMPVYLHNIATGAPPSTALMPKPPKPPVKVKTKHKTKHGSKRATR